MRLSLFCKYINKRTAQNYDNNDTNDFYRNDGEIIFWKEKVMFPITM